MMAEAYIAVPLGLVASAEDLVRGRISNWIPAALLAGGILCGAQANRWHGIGTALLGAAAGFGILLIFYLLGKMGGGDVKLMAGFGAVLGAQGVLMAAFWTAIAGAVWAGFTLLAGSLRRKLRQRAGGVPTKTPNSIPYAPSIVIGVWLTLLAKAGAA